MNMEKEKVSQDFLYKYLTRQGVNITTLSELMGVSKTMVNGCFRHNKDRNGVARNFPAPTLQKLNAALEVMAAEIRKAKIVFGSDQTYTNNRGATYDPATIEQVKTLHRYFKLSKFLYNTLGWKGDKISITLRSTTSKAYGCISQEHVDRINAELLAVAGMLGSIEVVGSDDRQ